MNNIKSQNCRIIQQKNYRVTERKIIKLENYTT